jgi:uncharacterized protein (DUF1330 family)
MMTGVALGAIAIQGLHAQAKPPVYYIAQNEVTNPDAYIKEFVLTNQPIVKAAGGRFLIAGGKMTALDGDAPKARIKTNSDADTNAFCNASSFRSM